MSLSSVATRSGDIQQLLSDSLDYSVPPTSRSAHEHLSSHLAESVKGLRREQQSAIRSLLSAVNAEHFRSKREDVLRDYFSYALAILALVRQRVDPSVLVMQNEHGLRALERRFEEHGAELIGAEATSEMLFLLPTARRAFRLASLVSGTRPENEADAKEDRRLATQYSTLVYFSELHVRLIVMLLSRKEPLPAPDVLDEILAGARTIVEMYSAIRRAFRLRKASHAPGAGADDSLDDEDRQLLAFSAHEPWRED